MTTAEILSLSRKKILEESTDLVTDATLLIYANLAYKDVIKKAFPNTAIKTATVSFLAGVGTLPADFGTLYTDAVDTSDNIFPEVNISDFIRRNANSDQAVTIENDTIKASPLTTTSLSIKYYQAFETLTAVANPTIDDFLHEPIVYGIVYRALEDLQDEERSQFYSNKFDTMLERKLSDLSNYEEDGQRGNIMFNGIQVISGGGNYNDPNRF